MRTFPNRPERDPARGPATGRARRRAAAFLAGALALLLAAPSAAGAGPQDRVTGPGDEPLSRAEGRNIHALLANHQLLLRRVAGDYEDAGGAGVLTLTWVADPEGYPWLVEILRDHVAQMEGRLQRGARIYQRDPIFRAIFDAADVIDLDYEDIPGGIMVIETSPDPIVAEAIRLHAEKVNVFLAQGQAALLPPTARRGPGPGP